MEKYKASASDAQVIGAALQAYTLAIKFDEFKHVLEEYDLKEIDSETWYPQQLTLDIQKAIHDSRGGSEMLVSVGMKIIESAQFPPMDTLEDAADAFASSYPMNFRNQAPQDIISATKVKDGLIKVVNASPHSDDMIYGYVYALAQRFKPEGANPIVRFDDLAKRDGDGNTILWIEY